MEPALFNGRYKPDFLAVCVSKAFYVEGTVCGQSDRNAGALRASPVCRAIVEIDKPWRRNS